MVGYCVVGLIMHVGLIQWLVLVCERWVPHVHTTHVQHYTKHNPPPPHRHHQGALKLADFGLAKVCASPDRLYTTQVFAHWYRPPELLFGSKLYSTAVDVWAAGCVFAEMLLRRPWFAGTSEIDVLGKIFQVDGVMDIICGTFCGCFDGCFFPAGCDHVQLGMHVTRWLWQASYTITPPQSPPPIHTHNRH